MSIILEYIWIDAYDNLRSKTKVSDVDYLSIEDYHIWNYDGSSTGQAEGHFSDIILKPVAVFKDPFRKNLNSKLVMCETFTNLNEPHPTNKRHKCINLMISDKIKDQYPWFGIEQEYFIFERSRKPYKWISDTNPGAGPQGPYYCSNGGNYAFGREIAEEHLEACLYAGIKICGLNAEVAPSQWEFQIGPCLGSDIGDHLWIARYILNRIAEKHNAYINLHPKPLTNGDWNGSGAHTNFSTKLMRDDNGIDHIYLACKKLVNSHDTHIKVYGKYNEKRLTGKHETASIDKCTYGKSDRGASIRIPINVVQEGKGYLEDRRPASNADPYEVSYQIVKTICDV